MDRDGKKLPKTIYNLRPDRTFIIPQVKKDKEKPSSGLKGFLYVPEGKAKKDGIPIVPENMIHIKMPYPLDPLEGFGEGLSPISAAAYSADVDNDITKFLKLFFENGAMPPGVLTSELSLTETDAATARERWKEVYGGYENWADVVVLGKGLTYQRMGLTFDEMGFSDLDGRNESRLAMVFGVPLTLLENRPELISSTYNNKREDRRMFWEDRFRPEMKLIEAEFRQALGEKQAWPAFDFAGVPALQRDIPQLVTAAHQMWTMGTPANVAFQTMGLDVEGLPDGDVAFLPFGVMRAGEQPTTPVAGTTEKSIKSRDQQIWEKADRLAQSWESKFSATGREQFQRELRAILAIIGDAKAKATRKKATLAWNEAEEEIRGFLTSEQSGKRWTDAFLPLIGGVMLARTEHDASLYDIPLAETSVFIDPASLYAVDWFNDYTLKFAQPIMATTERELSALLQQSVTDGWSIPETQRHITEMFDQWMGGNLTPEQFEWFAERMPPYRIEMIARTETMRASNSAANQLYDEWGMDRQWVATVDNRVRDTHLEANGQTVAVGEPFSVGGERLMFPGDPEGSPGNTINCRCTVAPYNPAWE